MSVCMSAYRGVGEWQGEWCGRPGRQSEGGGKMNK